MSLCMSATTARLLLGLTYLAVVFTVCRGGARQVTRRELAGAGVPPWYWCTWFAAVTLLFGIGVRMVGG